MSKSIDLTGLKFGRLTAVERVADHVSLTGLKSPRWLWECDCGTSVVLRPADVKNGNTSSCGCLRREVTAATNARLKTLALPSYEAMHARVRRERGKAADLPCVDCGAMAAEWSYDKTDPAPKTEVVSIWGIRRQEVSYSLDVHRYVPRCRSCHLSFDKTGRRKKAS